MGKTTIEWTQNSWPIVQGCEYASPGCTNCYVVPLLWRLQHNPLAKVSAPIQGLVDKDARGHLHFTGKVALRHDRMRDPISWQRGRKIFVPSHGDLFHKDVPDAFIDQVFAVMAMTPRHTYQVLTKRSARLREYFRDREYRARQINGAIWSLLGTPEGRKIEHVGKWQCSLPLPNVWLGVSTEDQKRLDQRLPDLLACAAAVRFISYEPALGPISLRGVEGLHWAIGGLESGANARDGDLQWLRAFVRDCSTHGVACFIKQIGRWPVDGSLCVEGDSPAYGSKDRAGRDMDEWPAELRVREFPQGVVPPRRD